MKKTILAITVTTALITGTISASGQSNDPKVEAAQVKVVDSKQDLKDAKHELNVEYPAFKKDAEAKIAANEVQISELRKKADKPGNTPADNLRKQRIDDLERRNSELRTRLYNYEKERTGWEGFKGQFNHDMDNLHLAFNNFGKDIKK